MKKIGLSKTYVVAFLNRFAFLLLLPFLQTVIFSQKKLDVLIVLYGADLLIATLMCVWGYIRCKRGFLRYNKNLLIISRGVIIREHHCTNITEHGVLNLSKGIFLKLFSAVKLKVFTGNISNTAYIRNDAGKDIAKTFFLLSEDSKVYKSGIFRTLLMSASFSNSLTGLLAAVPLIRRTAAIIGAGRTAEIIETVHPESWLSFAGLPSVLSAISSLLFACWILGTASEFFSEYNLSLTLDKKYIKVSKGLIRNTTVLFSKNKIGTLVFRQSLLLAIWGLYSVRANINLLPGRNIHLLSAATATKCYELENDIFGKRTHPVIFAKPDRKAILGFAWPALLLLSVVSLGFIIFDFLLLKWILSITECICIIWLFFRIIALGRSSVTLWQNLGEVRYFSGMNFVRHVFPLDRIISSELSQSIFQHFTGRCNLKITIKLSVAVTVRIKHLKLCDAKKIIEYINKIEAKKLPE